MEQDILNTLLTIKWTLISLNTVAWLAFILLVLK